MLDGLFWLSKKQEATGRPKCRTVGSVRVYDTVIKVRAQAAAASAVRGVMLGKY